jgi:hypothetical protein
MSHVQVHVCHRSSSRMSPVGLSRVTIQPRGCHHPASRMSPFIASYVTVEAFESATVTEAEKTFTDLNVTGPMRICRPSISVAGHHPVSNMPHFTDQLWCTTQLPSHHFRSPVETAQRSLSYHHFMSEAPSLLLLCRISRPSHSLSQRAAPHGTSNVAGKGSCIESFVRGSLILMTAQCAHTVAYGSIMLSITKTSSSGQAQTSALPVR